MNEPFAFYEKTAEYVKSRAPFAPELGLILGTGLGPLAKQIENPVEIDYRDIPNFLVSTAPDHAGKLIFGTLNCITHALTGYALILCNFGKRQILIIIIDKKIVLLFSKHFSVKIKQKRHFKIFSHNFPSSDNYDLQVQV